jgi:hypothetical protein
MTPLQKAYTLGQFMAKEAFDKTAGSFAENKGRALAIGAPVLIGAGLAPEGERIGGGLGTLGGLAGGGKLLQLARSGGHLANPKVRGLAALTALLGGGYGGYRGGRAIERAVRDKTGAALGDPNFWGGGTPPPGAEMPPPQTAEDAVQLLPAGTFQGAQIKITPDGQRNTTVKVTPDAVAQPDALAGVFQAEPTAKVEISQPEMNQVPGGGEAPAGMPPEAGAMPPEAAAMAAEAGKMAALRAVGLR